MQECNTSILGTNENIRLIIRNSIGFIWKFILIN
jgi:hypothetical protein